MILLDTFLYTFLLSSGFCFVIDLSAPWLRYNGAALTRGDILNDYKDMLPLVSTNLLLSYPFFYYVEENLLFREPNQLHWIINFVLWMLMTDLIFYTIHRILHQRAIYFIHSVHHQYKYTYGFGAIYAHPIEFWVGNLFPVAAPMALFHMPRSVCNGIVIFSTFFTVVLSHGGYIVSKSHLNHHLKYRCNYGLAFMDRLLGTQNNQPISIKSKPEEIKIEVPTFEYDKKVKTSENKNKVRSIWI